MTDFPTPFAASTPPTPMPTPVSKTLKAMNVPHRQYRHPGPIHSLAQAARERGQDPEQVVRSILFRMTGDGFVLVLIAGPQQIDWRALRHYLGQSRLSMASKEEVHQVTGYHIGAVSPFGLPSPLRVLVDESVFARDEVSIGSGERGATVILRSADLMRALGDVEKVKVGKDTTR